MRISICFAVFIATAASATTVSAEEIRDTLVVTASRIPVPLSASGSSVTVIDREQIDARQSVFAVDLLQDVPGVAVSRSGSIGAQTQVRIRGAEANQVLVLIDGIEVNDPAGNDEFAFQDLTTWDVERIEVVRGPQSALWGSDALAGVINVITRQPTDEFSAAGFAEGGAFDTYSVGGRVSGEVLGARTGLSLSRVNSNGSNSSRSGDEDDGYQNTTGSLTLAGSPTDNLELDLVGRYTSTSKDFDASDFSTSLPADSTETTDVDLGYFRTGGTLKLMEERWTQSLQAAWTTTDTENANAFGDNGSTGADKYGIYYQTSWQFTPRIADAPGDSVTLALLHEQQDFTQRGDVLTFPGPAPGDPPQVFDPNQNQDQRTTAAVLEAIYSPLPRSSVSLSARYDNNSDYDDVATYRATTAWTTASTRTRLHASYGTGQKAPTFVERFGFFPDTFTGNPDLEPETSKGWEAGLDQPLFEGRVSLGATYFHEDLKNEINGFVFDPGTGGFTADNLQGESQRRGVEITALARLTGGLRLAGSYTYLDATEPDALTGDDKGEVRRPRHVATVNGDWRFFDNRADVNLNLSYVGDRTDVFFGPPNFDRATVNLDSYYLASVAVSYRATEQVRVYARVENLLDQNYEDVYGYNTPGLGAYAGLGWSF
ncbi:MAG: TonB-dependent receptor [Gammaproteobacteria bacterium]|nr:TonB-dependent receptor [Gammaproteobacteria bacterium]